MRRLIRTLALLVSIHLSPSLLAQQRVTESVGAVSGSLRESTSNVVVGARVTAAPSADVAAQRQAAGQLAFQRGMAARQRAAQLQQFRVGNRFYVVPYLQQHPYYYPSYPIYDPYPVYRPYFYQSLRPGYYSYPGFGRVIINRTPSRSTTPGSHYFGDPHASQFIPGTPHPSQYRGQ